VEFYILSSGNVYPALVGGGNGEGDKEEKWYPLKGILKFRVEVD